MNKLHSLQGQTRHMNKRIESVNFSRNIIVLVTHIALMNSKLCRIHNCSIPTDQQGLFWDIFCSILANSVWPFLLRSVQPVPLMATALLLLTDRGKQDCCLFGMIEANPSDRRHRAKPLSEFIETSRLLEQAQKPRQHTYSSHSSAWACSTNSVWPSPPIDNV